MKSLSSKIMDADANYFGNESEVLEGVIFAKDVREAVRRIIERVNKGECSCGECGSNDLHKDRLKKVIVEEVGGDLI